MFKQNLLFDVFLILISQSRDLPNLHSDFQYPFYDDIPSCIQIMSKKIKVFQFFQSVNILKTYGKEGHISSAVE